ncbi:MAG: hypothetical protein RL077_5451 [Verrucomicrobiota bacterium]|jgi:plasmid stabilization system protein ParE
MNYRVVIETRAIRDIDEATGWIASQASDAAERWFNAIEAEINTLSRFPERSRGHVKTGCSSMNCASWSLADGTDATG